jgi:hypothetical protein
VTTSSRTGTDGGQALTNQGMALAIRALHTVLRRLEMDIAIPFRDLSTFKSHWLREGASGSWQARRDLVEALFEPLLARLFAEEDLALEATLAEPVSPRGTTGWAAVDDEIRELKRRFQQAQTPQDYRAIGTHCVGVLEALSRQVYDPTRHLREGEEEPPADKTKQRLGRYIQDAVPGQSNAEIRALAVKAIELAQAVKHRQTPTRRDAGISADAVVLVANILRRFEKDAKEG